MALGDEVLPLNEMRKRIKSFLYEQIPEDKALTAALIIHTCNKQDKVKFYNIKFQS